MSNDWAKVLLPMIRKVYPTMIAQQIVGAQPMTMPESPTRLQAYDEPFNMYPYIAQRHSSMWDLGFNPKDLQDMKEWCVATLQSSSWHYLQGKFFFRNETDRTMFMLRWS
jgi:hypothetical protein